MRAAAKDRKKSIKKIPYFRSSGSFKVIDVDMTEKFVTSACCDRQHDHAYLRYTHHAYSIAYHEKLANPGKITTFTGVPIFDALMRRLH